MSYNESLNPNSNYPHMTQSQWNSAPWNEPYVPEKDFDVTCCQVLSRTATVTTNNYIPGACGVDYEYDDEGGCCACGWQDDDDTSYTNWGKAYREEHYTPLDLIKLLGDKCKNELKELEELGSDDAPYYYKQKKRELELIIEECTCWTDDETVVCPE